MENTKLRSKVQTLMAFFTRPPDFSPQQHNSYILNRPSNPCYFGVERKTSHLHLVGAGEGLRSSDPMSSNTRPKRVLRSPIVFFNSTLQTL
ncbi:hypothetical protein QYF36_004608 [Acer negundo]|nr:hypothetical protein QYF36_004608 [Acer negundo]